jgi:hypothetical protein
MSDEHLFIGFDCAYRTLGWCVLGYNPRALTNALRERNEGGLKSAMRNLFRLRAGGVEDVLGQKIDTLDPSERAKLLAATLDRIVPRDEIARATVIIEGQPRKRGVGFNASVRDTNQTVEAHLVFYFSVVRPAQRVYLISAGKKNKLACALLGEAHVKTYAARKMQSRRAYVRIAEHFNFSAHAEALNIKRVKADRADACVQIIAAIFLCTKNI